MATLNEMIAQGAQFNVPDPTAQYNKMAQMQKYQQENELAKMQMEEYGRARQESNALRQFLPGLNESNRSQLLGYGAAGQGVYKTLAEGDTQQRLRDQAKSQADLNESSILKNAVAQTRDAVAGIDPNDVESYAALRTSVLTQYPKLAPYMPAAWDANVKQRLITTAASVLEGQKPRPPVILKPGDMAIPGNDPRLTGLGVTAPAAAAAAAVPPSVAEYQFAKTVDGGSFVGSYQDFVKAKADATRAPTPVAAPQALPASVQEYEYAKTVPGGSFVGTYQDFVKAKADAARAPAPISAPQALPQSVAEYNFAKTPEGGGFVGTLTDFMQARAEATRAPAPIVAPQAQPASVLEYNFAKTLEGGGFVGTYQDFVRSKAEAGRAPVPITAPPTKVAEYEFAKTPAGGSYKGTYQQFLNLGKSEGGGGAGGAAGTGTVEVVNPNDSTKTIIVTKARAVAEGLTPAKAIEGLTPKMKQQLEADYPKATVSLRSYQSKSAAFIKDIEELRDSEGLDSVTGFAAGRAPGITDAGRAAVALYNKIIAKGGFQSLQDMRDMSKTGGALGNTSNRDISLLIDAFAAIDRKQSASDVKKALNNLINELKGSQGRMKDAYDLTYEYRNLNAAPAAAVTPSAGFGRATVIGR